MLLIPDGFPILNGTRKPFRHPPPVRILRGYHLLSAGMIPAGNGKIMSIERLIGDNGVSSALPGTHEGSGNIPGAGPHCDPKRGISHRRIPA